MRRSHEKLKGSSGAIVFVLSLCFLSGIFIGRAAAGIVYDSGSGAAESYLENFIAVRSANDSASLGESIFAYLRYPVLSFLLGFTPYGVAIIPIALFSEAFLLSFAVNAFTLSFAGTGMIFAFATIGLRYLFVLPCLIFVSSLSFRSSLERGGMIRRGADGSRDMPALLLCVFVLCCGAVIENSVFPEIVAWLCSHFPV